MNLIHLILVVSLTACGFLSLLAGLLVIIWRRTGWLFQTYLWPLILTMTICMMTLAWDWVTFTVLARSIYIALSLLMMYVVFRAFMAREKQFHRYTGWRLEFMDEVAVTLCILFNVIIAAWIIGLQFPVWIIAIVAPVTILLGRVWMQKEKDRYLAQRLRKKSYGE